MRLTISPAAAQRLLVDVVQLLLELRIGKLPRSLKVVWNPLTKRLDPPRLRAMSSDHPPDIYSHRA